MDDEQALLERARKLDEEALGIIFDTYYVQLYRYIYHHVGHVQTAEDLAARVFHRLLEEFSAGRGPQHHLKGWLYRVAHNLVIDEARRQKHRDHLPLDERLVVGDGSLEDQAHRSILAGQARRALLTLSPKQRAVVILRFLIGLENDEVAHILGLPRGAVKALQHRGLAALRRNLATAGVELGEIG